jgi:hypothetical protein
MIFQHYRELVTPADAVKWWSIAPEASGKIVRLSAKSTRLEPAQLCPVKSEVSAERSA